ncbi:DNA polymerase III subunit beta [Prevotella pallens]|uniref:DNA polymerase III subunit beta n=1 Tax=Prevotella pallens TaxID=60133 RepID=UPI001CAFD672|nr:DNA polymerase III subunit beta [Prevotella pallens]MBF1502067.1 DNA polymerase III subunit beta [Prevotella pallens]
MRFTISSTALSSRLLSLSRVINSKNTLPILNCFVFEVQNGQLTITASDSENVVCMSMNLDSLEGEGKFAVNNQNILDAVKELPEQPLTIDVNMDEHTIYVSYQNGSYNFPVIEADEFPIPQPLSTDKITITLSAEILIDNITRSLFATAQDELHPVMNGIYFDLKPDGLAVVATDGHKLVRNRVFSVTNEVPASFILPKKPATLLKGFVSKDSSDVVISFDARSAEISFGEGNLICRLIDGKYPNYNSVIPENNPYQIIIDRKSFIGAVRRVLPFASDSSQLVRFHIANGQLDLSAEDIDFSTSAKESMTCTYEGNPMSIGFKGSSILEILNNLQSEEVNIQLADPSRAGIIVPAEQPEGENVLMLVMPVLLND